MSVSLMFRRMKDGVWSATIQRGRSHAIVGMVPGGWKAAIFFHDSEGELQVRDVGIFGSRKEAMEKASERVLGGGWRDE